MISDKVNHSDEKGTIMNKVGVVHYFTSIFTTNVPVKSIFEYLGLISIIKVINPGVNL